MVGYLQIQKQFLNGNMQPIYEVTQMKTDQSFMTMEIFLLTLLKHYVDAS